MPATIRFKRGNESNLTSVTLLTGEPAFTIDTDKLFIGNNNQKIEVGNRSVGPVTTLVRASSSYWGDVYFPVSQDFRRMVSYRDAFLGVQDVNFNETLGTTKWAYLNANPGSSLTLQLCSIEINGKQISMTQNMTSIVVNSSNLYTRDNGFGLGQANYIDFTNAILSKFNMFTRLLPSTINGTSVVANACILDNFKIAFEERYTGFPNVQPQNLPPTPYYYGFNTTGTWTIKDNIGDAIRRVEIPSQFGYFRIF